MLAAEFGLSILVAQSALAFTLVKSVGAAYLVYLDVRMLLSKQLDDAGQAVLLE